jgi:membrane-associated phospholipid phosphatase
MESALARRSAVVLGASTVLFGALVAIVLLSNEADRLDSRFVAWVNRSAPESLVEAMRVVTYAGSGPVLVAVALLSGALLARRGRSRAASLAIAATIGGLVTTQILKAAIRRTRPELDEPYVQLTTYAFPSGHALAATATYGALAIVLGSASRRRRDRGLILVGFSALIVLVAASRVILGAHYLLDVLAGTVGGIALLSALVLAFQLGAQRTSGVRVRRDEQAQRPGIDA